MERPRRPRTAEERRAIAAQWAHPPVAVTVARGLRLVGTFPVLIVSSFLAALSLWLVLAAYGTAPFPGAMVLMTALPPVHSLLIDVGAVLTAGGESPAITLAFLAGLLVLRAAFLSFWLAAIMERLERWTLAGRVEQPIAVGPIAEEASGQELSRVVRRAARSFGSMLGIEAGFYVLAMATALLAVGFAFGQLAVIIGLIGGLYFLVFAPIAAVAEGVAPRPAARLSFKAARLPGPRHMMATAAYVAFTLVVSLFAPASRVFAATPTITTWLFVLFVTFLHVVGLAMFSYRWVVVRDRVLTMESESIESKRGRPAGAPLR